MITEFRQNLVSGEWVLISSKRAARPNATQQRANNHQTQRECPFERLETQQEIVWKYPDDVNPQVILIKNKYPAVQFGPCGPDTRFGPFTVHGGNGEHDVFVYPDHELQLHQFTPEQLTTVIRAYKKRKNELKKMDGCIRYVMIFHNFGAEAGASVHHSHSQIMSMPILPPSVQRSLSGAYEFFKKHAKRVSDVMMLWEKEGGRRMVHENDFFVAFCPFVSKYPGEIRIYPKNGQAHFSDMHDDIDPYFADVLGTVLKKISKAFNEPAYNFYIHTAPTEEMLGDMHEYYSWHVEIVPKLKIDAGLELGTGIVVNPLDPDDAAIMLRNA